MPSRAEDPRATPWSAVVLSGGTARRLGGADKAALVVGGRTLLERALAAVDGAAEVVVVGPAPDAPAPRPVTFTSEEPPGSGPAAALLHGVAQLTRPAELPVEVVVVLAVDMALVGPATVRRLLDAVAAGTTGAVDGALLDDGRRQPLAAAYRREALLRAAPAPADRPGLAVRSLIADLRLVTVPARAGEGADVDTWEDLRAIRERTDGAAES